MQSDGNDFGTSGLRKDPILGIQDSGSSCIVRLGGELDLYNAARLGEALEGAVNGAHERIVVDLTEVEFVDSTALGVLIEARTKLDNRRAFLLAGPGVETRRALQISGLDRHFALYESVAEALAARL